MSIRQDRPIRTLIVDDEALARERIRSLIADDPELEIVGECADGAAAVAAIRRSCPDLLFLDVQMPELDGFEVLRAVDHAAIGAIVFVTAFDRYALLAFEFVALDYLLKPFGSARFGRALARAKTQIRRGADDQLRRQLGGLLQNAGKTYLERIVIRESGRISFMKVVEIRFIEAQGNYARVQGDGEVHLVRRRMNDLEAALDPAKFLRIHRSFIVNMDWVKELTPLFHGDYRLTLQDGTELTSNRSFKENLKRFLDDPL